MQRPTGVTILAILALIGGVFGIIVGLGALFGGALFGGMAASAGADASTAAGIGGLFFIIGILTLLGAVLELAFFFGAWTAKAWGWILGVIAALWSIGVGVIGAVLGGDIVAGLMSNLVSFVIAGVILYYLNTPAVKQYFGRA
jgi:hypothetical protein